jgi:hypothetical protein
MGGAVLSTFIAWASPVWSLTTSEVAEKLGPVPVFTIGVLEGDSVTFLEEPISTDNGGQVSISRIYLNPEDAAADLAQIKEDDQTSDNPALPDNIDVAVISLGEVFCISQMSSDQPCENTQPQDAQPPAFIYFPDRNQLGTALSILEDQGTQVPEDAPLFVPLFFTRIQVPDQQPRTVPVIYFSKEDLERDITEAKETTPELADATFDIQVTTLERVIGQLIGEDNPGMAEIRFIPIQSQANP